ncbi:hypothetical protein [Rhizobium rhizogenes]|uniref:Uncharacterized protein n=1 Tax=Rhizobium rhizogenes TaxID=359 RepID=A0AA92C0K1_RHIRH|nr:hypothetical protein [Rhizobium rhizogenes]PVE50689.1 hypothetical protein DC430_21165 [Rhizobium rhizogenes]PVE62310.1 hypothetical protein DC415_22165 [Agrobacterium tumefaciens]PVE70493.1 hypothetical protein DCP16_22165 [Sphingomonas sp. TPD3009]
MGIGSIIRQFAMRRVIKMALAKPSGPTIPTSGDEARKNDLYLIYLLDSAGVARFLVYNLVGDQLKGKWSLDGQNFIEERSLELSELANYQLWIQHYYRGWTFYTIGLPKFLRYRWSRWPWIRVTYDRFLQSRYNKRELPRQDRMKVLRYILSETVKDRAFQTHPTSLLTHFYTVRWVHRPDKDELMTYYTFLLDSMKEAHDLEATQQHGYKLKSQALNTITTFDLEEQRHNDNYNTQNRLFWLTAVLIAIGLVQAAAAAYDTWWRPPDSFTGTIGSQAIDLIRK